MSPVTPADIEAFDRAGVVCLRQCFEPAWVELVAAGIDRNLADVSPLGTRYTPEGAPGLFQDDYCSWQRIDEYRRFAFDSPAASIVAALLRSETARFFHEHMLVKEPGTHERAPWHHDQPYYPLAGDQLASLWLPVDPVPASSAVEFVAGSHRGPLYMPRTFIDHEDYAYEPRPFPSVPDIDAARQAYDVVSWDMEPGDCLVFHMRTLHCSPGTEADSRRRVLTTRWLGDDVVFEPRPGTTSPPFPGLSQALSPGQPLDLPSFPLVFAHT